MRYLSVNDALKIHERVMRRYGQTGTTISPEKLESALARPQSTAFGEEIFPSVFEKASALLEGIIVGHPFIDGNKRAALGCMLVFLRLNGIHLQTKQDRLYEFTSAVASGTLRGVDNISRELTEMYNDGVRPANG